MANIAFIGLGNMGMGMCLNLVKAGHRVTAFDLDGEATARAELKGARAASSVADAVCDAGVVVSMLPNGNIVDQVYHGTDGVTSAAQLSTLFIDCSTISVGEARAIAKKWPWLKKAKAKKQLLTSKCLNATQQMLALCNVRLKQVAHTKSAYT